MPAPVVPPVVVNQRELADLLPTLIEMREPVMVFGAPGVGKSQIIQQALDRVSWPCQQPKVWDFRAVLADPVDLRGLPDLNRADGLTHWRPPSFLPQEGECGVFFMDELPQAPVSMQSALLQLTLDRGLGEYRLPAGVAMIAAGNRPEDRSGSNRLITALASRFVQFTLQPTLEPWLDYVREHQLVSWDVPAFLSFKPSLFCEFEPGRMANPNPRNWVKASRVMQRLGGNRALLRATLVGIVGEGAATEFLAFAAMAGSLPSAAEILANPSTVPLPRTRMDALWALGGMMAAHFSDHLASADEAKAFWTFLGRLPQEQAYVAYREVSAAEQRLVRMANDQKKTIGAIISEGLRGSGRAVLNTFGELARAAAALA